MRTPTAALTALVSVAGALTVVGPAAAAAPHEAGPRNAITCVAPALKAPKGATLVSVTATANAGGTLSFPAGTVAEVPSFCQVDVVLTHGTAGDRELVEIQLPRSGWTGRFQALGGAGYLGGDFGPSQAIALKAGYAVGTTDAGATPTTGYTADWALTAEGEVNSTVLENFAERGPHELAVVGKAVTNALYGRSAAYSYWNGCSTGGRQGYMEAQRHPDDFDGILANAPALSWDRFAPADLWPAVVQNEEGNHLTSCELDAFTAAAVQACDGPTKDGIIDDPLACGFDPRSIVGQQVICDGETLTLSESDAEVIAKFWDGPRTTSGERLWFGLTKGADLDALTLSPFPVAASWVQNLLNQDPAFDVTHLTYDEYESLFEQSVTEYHDIIGSDDPDLSAFRRSGGKLLTWHGGDDQLVPLAGTVRYHDAVRNELRTIDDFYRLFIVPGASHCQAGAGAAPGDPLGALVDWVEKGKAPATLTAGDRDIPFYRG